MTELGPILARLGLAQYLHSLIDEGFDTWETVLDITESDLDALNVKLGHRRRLQREIASARGLAAERLLAYPPSSPPIEYGTTNGDDMASSTKNDAKTYMGGVGGKRKYRRHPKSDGNAPERPPSAYVIFSNKIREELRPLNLTFTDIAKRVGEAWQVLQAEEKEPYESQASAAKEKFHAAMAKYKKTDAYKEYALYLADFKSKNGPNAEGKRARLETESNGSLVEFFEQLPRTAGRRRESLSSVCLEPTTPSDHPSPRSLPVSMAPPLMFGGRSSAMEAMSPGSISPSVATPKDHIPQLSPRAASQTEKTPFDRNPGFLQGQALPRMDPLENRDIRILPRNAPNNPKSPQDRSSPQHTFSLSNRIVPSLLRQDSSVSSLSSTLSGGTPTSSSGYTSMMKMEEGRSPMSLPPLSIFALGQSKYSPHSNQNNTAYTLPPPSHSPFLPSPSSGSESSVNHEYPSREAFEFQRSQHRPFLPNPNRLSSERDQKPNVSSDDAQHEAFLNSHVDPLSVLAYAGRMVDRETR